MRAHRSSRRTAAPKRNPANPVDLGQAAAFGTGVASGLTGDVIKAAVVRLMEGRPRKVCVRGAPRVKNDPCPRGYGLARKRK